jgi:glycosyltransferase involved in cell wall biosynthesis
MKGSRKMRLAIVTTHPIQYQAPLWRRLAQGPDLNVQVYFGSDLSVRGYMDAGFGVTLRWDVPLTEGYAHTFLSTRATIQGLRAHGLHGQLSAFNPDCALICGYTPLFYWEALGILRTLRVPVIIRAETTDVAKDRGLAKSTLRSALLRGFYSQCCRFLAIGEHSRAHYLAQGVPMSRIGWAPYCIDSDLFENQVRAYLPERLDLRRKLGFTEPCTVFVFSGKLIPRKDPLALAHALEAMPEAEQQNLGLIVVGDGEQRPEMEAVCRRALGGRAVFAGFVNQSQLGSYYAAADCLVLPSHSETWGLVVNEALHFGLPAIVSDRVGCHPDLIIPGKTGFVFPHGNVDALKSCLYQAIEQLSGERIEMSHRCREHVRLYSVEKAVDGILTAAKTVCMQGDLC